MANKKVLVLYAEIQGYTIAWLEALAAEGIEVHVVNWDKVKKTPYVPKSSSITIHLRSQFDDAALVALVDKLSPSVILASGWMDDGYVKACKYARTKGVKVALFSDRQWYGTLRQWVNVLFRFRIQAIGDYFWVPGPYQYEYARKLGFAKEKIFLNAFTADTPRFTAVWPERQAAVQAEQSFTILYVGRLSEEKALDMLTSVFIESLPTLDPRWRLKIVGSGPVGESLPKHERIDYVPFVEPNEVPQLAKQCAFFCLPSYRDQFPLVLHEFTSAGVPLLVSSACGGVPILLANGYNGYVFQNRDREDLKRRLLQMCSATKDEIAVMSEHSFELSKLLSISAWVGQVFKMLNA